MRFEICLCMSMKAKLIIVARSLSPGEKKNILSELENDSSRTNLGVLDSPESNFDPFQTVQLSLEEAEKSEINRRIFSEVLSFGEIKNGDVPITDSLMYQSMSLWHYQKMRVYFFVRNASYEIESVRKIMQQYTSIDLYTENAAWEFFPYDTGKLRLFLRKKKNKEKRNYGDFLKYSVFFAVRVLSGLFQVRKLKKTKHLLIDHSLKQTVLDIHTLQKKQANYYMEYLFAAMNKDFIILDDREIPKLRGKSKFFSLSFHNFRTEYRTFFGELVLLRGLLSAQVRKEATQILHNLQREYQKIEALPLSPVQRFIFNYFRSLHPTNSFFVLKYLSYRRFFQRYPHLKTISSVDENGPRIKSVLDAARQNKIKTLGIQHGSIHPLHPSYMFTPSDRKRKIVPDITLVWGAYWKRLLIEKGNYPEDSIKITGQIRTDIIPRLLSAYTNDPELNPENKRIIMFASQFQRDEKLRRQAALDCFESVRDMEDALLLVKLHPSEKNEKEYYHHLAGEVSCSNYKVLYDYELYKLISISDVVITSFSTVGAEAVYFHKPLVIHDPLRQDLQGYHRQGVAFQATNAGELRQLIRDILAGERRPDARRYEAFINEYAYRIDGDVVKRVLEAIRVGP